MIPARSRGDGRVVTSTTGGPGRAAGVTARWGVGILRAAMRVAPMPPHSEAFPERVSVVFILLALSLPEPQAVYPSRDATLLGRQVGERMIALLNIQLSINRFSSDAQDGVRWRLLRARSRGFRATAR